MVTASCTLNTSSKHITGDYLDVTNEKHKRIPWVPSKERKHYWDAISSEDWNLEKKCTCQYDGVIRPVAAKKSYIRSNVKCCQITEKDPLVKNLIKTNMEQINHCRLRLTKHGSFTKKINVSLFNPHQKIKDKVKQSTDKENKPSWSYIYQETWNNPHIASNILWCPKPINHLLIVAQCMLQVSRVERENIWDSPTCLHPHAKTQP